jgi:hypothetical protein
MLHVRFRNKLIFYGEELLTPGPTPKLEEHPLVGCPRLLIQYIRSYPPCLKGVSSIRNLRTRHAVVRRDPPNMAWDGRDWIDLAQDRDQWRALVNAVMNVRVP